MRSDFRDRRMLVELSQKHATKQQSNSTTVRCHYYFFQLSIMKSSSRLPSVTFVFVALFLPLCQSFQTPALTTIPQKRVFYSRTKPSSVITSRTVLVQQALEEELPKFTSDVASSQSTSFSSQSSTSTKDNRSLIEKINDYGMSLKRKAQSVDSNAQDASVKKTQWLLKAKACLYWMLYIIYRGYRGFFIILPAVFRETYSKMETVVNYKLLDDDDDNNNNNNDFVDLDNKATLDVTSDVRKNRNALDVNPSTGKVRWRTRITVSVLTGIVTMTYVLGGLWRVVMKFMKTIIKTASLSGSFSAAADEVEENEEKLKRVSSNKKNVNGWERSSNDLGF